MRLPGRSSRERKSKRRRRNDNSVPVGFRVPVVGCRRKNQGAMSKSPKIRITLALSAAEHRAYVQAARILTRVMGRRAPAVNELIMAQLVGRDATGVADHHLDSIEWPLEKGRVISLREPRLKLPRSGPRRPSSMSPRRSDLALPADPSRN